MPLVRRQDGVEISWSQRGRGPALVLTAHWYAHPAALEGLVEELVRDHRVITYDQRGTGASTRDGPYDVETDSGDLEAVIEAAGGPAVALGWGDGAMRSVCVAARRPDLVPAVVAVGGNPLGLAMLEGLDSPAASAAVHAAFVQGLTTDYRAAVRGLLRVSSPQMSEAEARARVDEQIAYCSHDAALARFDAWHGFDPCGDGTRLGDRLTVLLFSTDLAPVDEIERRNRERLPGATVEVLEDGPLTRPELTAAATRAVAARLFERERSAPRQAAGD